MFTKIRTVTLILTFAISIALTIFFMYLLKAKNRFVRRVWGTFTLKTLSANIIVHGEADPEAGLMILNHRSMSDIILMESILPSDPCWIAKAELAKIPFYGHIIKAPKNIAIEREDRRGLITLLKLCKERLEEGRTLMIFPEGTRSQDDSLLEFKPGAKVIAEKYNLKVQPIVILGTDKVLDTKNLRSEPGDIHIKYLPSFNVTKGEPWLEELKETMQKEYLELKAL